MSLLVLLTMFTARPGAEVQSKASTSEVQSKASTSEARSGAR
jgi:hypothetical protein